VLRDRWGIAHIYARNEHDLFFAQGYAAARDRLFQFELWRRQATGTVAELLGPRELERDTGTRLFKFRGDLGRELDHYHPRGRQIVGAFVDGINAYVAETERNPALLPLELKLLGTKAGRWTPEVVISRHQGLLGNIEEELTYGRAVALLGPEKVKQIEWFHPHDPVVALDTALDGADAVVVATNHSAFEGLLERLPEGTLLVDPWNVTGAGAVFQLVHDRVAAE
jgi:penicillin amidase